MNQQEIKELQENGYEEWLDSRKLWEDELDRRVGNTDMIVECTKKQGWVIVADEVIVGSEFATEAAAINFLIENREALETKACRFEAIIAGDL